MGTWFRVIFLGLLAFGLVGCNLETKKPLFADGDAMLLLAGYPNLAGYERVDGVWKKGTDSLNFTTEDSHYWIKSGNSAHGWDNSGSSNIVVFFVPLEGPWWILQAGENSGSWSYVLVKAEPKELLIYSLECKRLQESGKFANDIEFRDSSCFIKDGADKMGLFKALIGSASEPSTKLVSEP